MLRKETDMSNHKLEKIQCFLLDMDGTVYLGNQLIDGAAEFLQFLKNQGKEFCFLTNNSSKSAAAYMRKLANLGLPVERKNLITSTDVLIHYLNKIKPGACLFPVGTRYFEQELIKSGFDLIYEFDASVDLDYVVVGFDTSLNYEKLFAACRYVRDGVPYLASHPDFNCPLENGIYMPDCGAIIEFIKASTGVAPQEVVGKPNPLVVELLMHRNKVEKNNLAMVGDRLYTDIALGLESSITSILVLTGESTRKDAVEGDVQPDFIYGSIKDLLEELQNLRQY